VSRPGQAWLFTLVALAALGTGFLLYHASREQTSLRTPLQGELALLQASLPDLEGRLQRLDQWRGKVVVINFWATWCAPCREEIPALIRVQEELAAKGLQVVGIAIDQADKVRPYAAEMRINYPLLVGELEAIDLSREAGNQLGGLPFTVVVDRAGNAVGTATGRVTAKKLEALVQPLL